MPIEDYFWVNVDGLPTPSILVRDSETWRVGVFQCRVCACMTLDPRLHVEWHEDPRG